MNGSWFPCLADYYRLVYFVFHSYVSLYFIFFAPSPSVLAPIYCINSIKARIVYNIFRLGWFWKCVYGHKPLKGLIYSLIDCLSWMFSWNHLFIVFPSYSVFIFIKYKYLSLNGLIFEFCLFDWKGLITLIN